MPPPSNEHRVVGVEPQVRSRSFQAAHLPLGNLKAGPPRSQQVAQLGNVVAHNRATTMIKKRMTNPQHNTRALRHYGSRRTDGNRFSTVAQTSRYRDRLWPTRAPSPMPRQLLGTDSASRPLGAVAHRFEMDVTDQRRCEHEYLGIIGKLVDAHQPEVRAFF